MSDTPRTDAFEALVNRPTNWWDFARELERENAALRADVYQCPPTSENDYDGFKWRDACEELEVEIAELRESLEIEKKRSSYWNDFADNATILNAQLRADKDRLDWLLDNISPDSVLWNVNPAEDSMSEGAPDPWRAAIDTARKRAQP